MFGVNSRTDQSVGKPGVGSLEALRGGITADEFVRSSEQFINPVKDDFLPRILILLSTTRRLSCEGGLPLKVKLHVGAKTGIGIVRQGVFPPAIREETS
jgi:hypothetical protein